MTQHHHKTLATLPTRITTISSPPQPPDGEQRAGLSRGGDGRTVPISDVRRLTSLVSTPP
ncbi:hypothetical protein E2C01_017506 [Portunus trituberculatus]|uniref:Uncharacterized protein n=1 Tax=Portunus trituberculatus TaxID=210409 RepID=A0A5B7DT17_PORTR|nr:hypothetical protein [Portunus trituberculatus]